ncbi:Hypothetical_protein [Hexamita inflata]|uniref:Hypothetical_protein n=1 Tax=Hexamita inflata TaxID=28002 RepID=A0AA86N5W3_9EUKA|nr:Hypothetical protein HINF_LOCUS1164 [Hexamita inflata]
MKCHIEVDVQNARVILSLLSVLNPVSFSLGVVLSIVYAFISKPALIAFGAILIFLSICILSYQLTFICADFSAKMIFAPCCISDEFYEQLRNQTAKLSGKDEETVPLQAFYQVQSELFQELENGEKE